MADNDLNSLKPTPGAKHRRKRVGRGNASGDGTTCGRGQKGQKSREGNNIPSWFEGGQMPLQRRLPKRGFTSRRKVTPVALNLRGLMGLDDLDVIGPQELASAGRIPANTEILKILGDGELDKKLVVKVEAFSTGARAKIEAAGGVCEVVTD